MIDVDHNATTPLHPAVREAMRSWLADADAEHNPSSAHRLGQAARGAVERARREVAAALGADALEVSFTSGGTEANNLAILGGLRGLRSKGRADGLLVSRIEHPSVLRVADALESEGRVVRWLFPDTHGRVAPDAVVEQLREHEDIGLVSLSAANHELGNRYDVAAIAARAKETRPGLLVHTDAVQAFGKVPVHFGDWGVDLMSVSSHKVYGPKGIGAVVHARGVRLDARAYGGMQERGIRPGTESTLSIRGFGIAARLAAEEQATRYARIADLRRRLQHRLAEMENVVVEGDPEHHVGNTLCCRFEACSAEALVMALDLEGVAVSAGAACSAGSTEPSAVLMALGRTREQAASSLRFSFGRDNTQAEVEQIAESVSRVVARARGVAS